MSSQNINLYKIWSQVPFDYYQQGVKKNLLQKIWHGQKIRIAKKILATLRFKNCLDLGCASGYMLSEIAKDYPDLDFVGVDVYDKSIEFAKKTYPHIKFITSDVVNLPLKDQSFDLIISYETFEHVLNPVRFLKEVRRVLKDDGTFILAMDSGSWLFRIVWAIWEKTFGKAWESAHLHPINHLYLEKSVKKAGFRVRKKILTHLGMEVVLVLAKDQN